MKNNGFDGLPQKVTDVDDLIPVYRGIVDFKYGDDTSQDQIDRFLEAISIFQELGLLQMDEELFY